MEEKKLVADTAYGLPVCSATGQSWGIKWAMPGSMKPYLPNIAYAPRLQGMIIEKCQAAFNTGQIDRDSAEIRFWKDGFSIMVRPGEACNISCRFDGDFSPGHNVDNASQAYALLIVFQIILREIYETSIEWAKDPKYCLEDEPTDRIYTVTRPIHAKPVRVWAAVDKDFGEPMHYFLARDREEAEERVPKNLEDIQIQPVHGLADITVGLLSFKVEIEYDDPEICPSKTLTILAFDSSHAKDEVHHHLLEFPTFSPVKKVTVLGEGKPIRAGVY